MRHYPPNSPHAAGRIVAMALLADGHLSRLELDVLDRLEMHTQLGLARTELHSVVHSFCEDVLATAHGGWAAACRVDAHTLYSLLAEIEDPALRRKVWQLCTQVVDADRHLAEGESTLLMAAVEHWGLQDDLQAPAGPNTR
jgi:hypothetical protein